MSDISTTKDSFPVIDITHKPRRMQGDNIRKEVTAVSITGDEQSDIPVAVTLERAIQFYEDNAEGKYATLYRMTAKWLKDYLTKNK